MTHVQYINCSKWKKIIGISLWIGATVGLGLGIYGLLNYSSFSVGDQKSVSCFLSYPNGQKFSTCQLDGGGLLGFIWVITLLANIGNYFMIWYTLNNHYRWIEIRCGQKPINHLTEREAD